MLRRLIAAACLAGLAGPATAFDAETLEWENLRERTILFVDDALFDVPFDEGPIHVVAAERGEMKTYFLVPCREGTHICGGSAHGPAGHLSRTSRHYVVTDAYGHRTFYLSPGGSGVLDTGSAQVPIAWD